MKISSIKLIVWDLDDTFWSGTISEEDVEVIPSCLDLLQKSLDVGVVHSICSKNDYHVANQKLIELGISDLFVFKSINWESKGNRVKEIISKMALRPENVLFIDDNHQNLKEVEFYIPNILIADQNITSDLLNYYSNAEKKDAQRKRLQQYRLLENKSKEASQFSSNIEFLHHSNINVQIKKDCKANIDRIHELIERTNQLNFTKLRQSKEELLISLQNADDAAYIDVQDRFGDYGTVGFYLVANNKLLHFLFSCRTIGLGIEQYVYNYLNNPQLDIVGDVYQKLNKNVATPWINQISKLSTSNTDTALLKNSILIKGPCDLSSTLAYIQGTCINTEFTYISKRNNLIESHNHSSGILASLYSENVKAELINELVFLDETVFNSEFWKPNGNEIIVLSTLPELNLGIYQRKSDGYRIAFGEACFPLTDPTNWRKYIEQKIFCAQNDFTEEFLINFSKKYDYIGKTSPSQYIDFLNTFLKKNNTSHLILILGSEIPFHREEKENYLNRHLEHKKFNDEISKFAMTQERIHTISFSDYIRSQSDYTNNINHYTPRVYHALATDLTTIIASITKSDIRLINPIRAKIEFLRRFIISSTSRKNSFIYRICKKIFNSLCKKSNSNG